jgi:hypothetical protein
LTASSCGLPVEVLGLRSSFIPFFFFFFGMSAVLSVAWAGSTL